MGLPVAVLATAGTAFWPGRVFPGFFVMENGLVPAVGSQRWTGFRAGVPLLWQVTAVDGVPVRGAAAVYEAAARPPVGTTLRYDFSQRGGAQVRHEVATMRFDAADYWETVGLFVIVGWIALLLGIAVGLLQPDGMAARAFLVQSSLTGLYGLTGSALYHPHLTILTPLHALTQALLPASFIHLALCFPIPRGFVVRHPAWLAAPYAVSALLLVWFLAGFYGTPPDERPFYAIFLYVGLALMLLVAIPAYAYWENRRSPRVRRQLNVVIPGIALAIGIALWAHLRAVVEGADVPSNWMALTVPLFYVSVAYAVLRHDLFDIDALLKQAAVYGSLTACITLAYAATIGLASALAPAMGGDTRIFTIAFVAVVAVLFEPAKAHVQRVVDRVFFRRRVDYRTTVQALSAALTSLLDRDDILARIGTTVRDGLQIRSFATILWDADGSARVTGPAAGAGAASFDAIRARLAGVPARAWVVPEDEERAQLSAAERAEVDALDAALVVPLALGQRLTGAFVLGPRLSGRAFGREDLDLLQTLAAQGAIALENALSYAELATLNRELEAKVEERTAALRRSYADLEAAQTQLVQSEKMASLGVLVAGVAHEINNPVSFVVNAVDPLRELVADVEAVATRHPELGLSSTLEAVHEAVDVISNGAQRTAGIVRDLRTFSRLGDSAAVPIDLHDSLDMSLRLLAPRLGDRVTVHRDYDATVPAIESAPGEVSQVMMNVLANAGDAVETRGNVWITTRAAGSTVTVTVRDDGCGIPAAALSKVFDPFFTTKPPGSGTGLGLAISHRIVSEHGGSIAIASTPGAGTTVTITLPVRQAHPAAAP